MCVFVARCALWSIMHHLLPSFPMNPKCEAECLAFLTIGCSSVAELKLTQIHVT